MARPRGRPKGSGTVTAKKRLFAKLVATGTKKLDAFNAVYESKGGKRQSRIQMATELSREPVVKALIEESSRAIIPIDITNIRRERLQNLGTIKGLSLSALDERVRLGAAVKLDEILADWEEKLRVVPVIAAGPQVETLVSELLQLSEQAKPTIDLEVVSDTESVGAKSSDSAEGEESAESEG